MVDLSTIEGLTDAQREALTAMFDQETSGLKSKADELLKETKTAKQLAQEKDATIEEARQAAVKAEEEKLVAEGKYKEALELREKEKAELIAKANERAEVAQKLLQERDYNDEHNKGMSLFHQDHKMAGDALLSKALNISYNDQGEKVTAYKYNGEVVANNFDEFKSWANEQTDFKRYLNGVDSSGAGAARSGSGASTPSKPYSEMSLQEQVAHNKQVNPQRK